jgi:hypothetical protein
MPLKLSRVDCTSPPPSLIPAVPVIHLLNDNLIIAHNET